MLNVVQAPTMLVPHVPKAEPKTAKQVLRAEAEGLEKPCESVKFLKHMQKHVTKVQTLQKRLVTMSQVLLIVGLGALSFAAYSFYTAKQVPNKRLGAS